MSVAGTAAPRRSAALVWAVALSAYVAAVFHRSSLGVLRIVAFWFPGRRNPMLVQLTCTLGQFGAVLGAVPLVALLHQAGWTPAFLAAAALGTTVLTMVVAAVRDTPHREHAAAPTPDLATVRRDLAAAWAQPGTRLGLWTHFVTQFSGSVFALLWGYPFLVQGQGMTPTAAASLLTLMTLAGLLTGPLVAYLCARHPFRRSVLVLTVTAATAAIWAVVLAWPGRAPGWLLVALVVVLAANGPGSAIGFDYARTGPPAHQRCGAPAARPW
ncbi:Major Facilitator Superfamily protein [Micromonospora sp. MW-13]|uniref:MFS transporter n=1 Tax=Micromonospora sp. MW-13 TaxID=2094022 RepID=UPI000E431CFC|nr:MFS transporter [Micromonospora sp. MW-13]RGC66706.1 Major Facilitator Superfamily protein [Micromonospora sp. MW-13]